MAQKALFPMRFLRVTQDEFGTYSHKGSRAQDHGGQSGAIDNATLAPYDGMVVRVRTDSSHEMYFVSDGAVQTPCGYVGVLTTTLMHDNVLDVTAGQRVQQGSKLGDEGGFGRGKKDTFAHHAHIEVSKGKQTTQTKNSSGTYCTPNQMSLYDAFYLTPDTMVYVKTAAGVLKWQRAGDAEGSRITDASGHTWHVAQPEMEIALTKPMRLTVTAANCEIFGAMDVDKPLGKLPKDTVYDIAEYYPAEVLLGSLRGNWVKIKTANGETYYCLALNDRTELANVWEPSAQDTVKTTAVLNVRSAPATSYMIVDRLAKSTTATLAEVADGWGYIKGKGWISLEYVSAAT